MNTQQSYRTSWKATMPTTRLGWIALGLIVVLASSTAAYALSPQLRQLFTRADAGLLYIEQANLGQELSLSQTTNGFTISVERVYADANRIIIGYNITSPKLTNNFATALQLTDNAGTTFPVQEIRSTAVQNTTRAFIASFDATSVQNPPGGMRLSVELGETKPASNPKEENKWYSVGTPVSFNFNIDTKVDRRIVDLRQTAQSSGIVLRLEQVRISPTGVNAILCNDSSDNGAIRWLSSGTLSTGVTGVDRIQSEASAIGTEGCHTLKFPAPQYYEQSGEWTLTVNELTAPDHVQGNDKRVTGTWTFRFSVPVK